MKKVFIFAAAIALTLASCGNKTQNSATGADSTNTETVDTTAEAETSSDEAISEESKATVANLTSELQKAVNAKDAKATVTTLANLQAIYKNLVEQGKLDEAKAYGSAIKKFVNDNAASLKDIAEGNTTIAGLVEGIKNLPTAATTTTEEAKAAINNDIASLASPAIAKGVTAVTTAKAAAEAVKNAPAAAKAAAEAATTKAVTDAKTKVESDINNAKQNANEKATKAVNNAKEKASAKTEELKSKANQKINDAANKTLKDLIK